VEHWIEQSGVVDFAILHFAELALAILKLEFGVDARNKAGENHQRRNTYSTLRWHVCHLCAAAVLNDGKDCSSETKHRCALSVMD
jgi:hypothetical protein